MLSLLFWKWLSPFSRRRGCKQIACLASGLSSPSYFCLTLVLWPNLIPPCPRWCSHTEKACIVSSWGSRFRGFRGGTGFSSPYPSVSLLLHSALPHIFPSALVGSVSGQIGWGRLGKGRIDSSTCHHYQIYPIPPPSPPYLAPSLLLPYLLQQVQEPGEPWRQHPKKAANRVLCI